MAEKTVLLICEKPVAARRVAEALDDAHAPKRMRGGQGFYEARHGGHRVLVCSALGHLYGVVEKGGGSHFTYPVWDYEWAPTPHRRGSGRRKALVKAISELAGEADEFMNACDFDTEGSLIGFMVLKYACKGAHLKAKRMKYSTLVEKELREAYRNPMPSLDYSTVEAGMCRHEVDWLYGINLSRALMGALKAWGEVYQPLSIGRVQGPTLNHLVAREAEIKKFVPTPYWTVTARVRVDDVEIPAEYSEGRISVKADAEKVARECEGKKGVVEEASSSTSILHPPPPFDLTTLQFECFRHHRFSPRSTLTLAERLYLDALISYPRTSSQKLPDHLGHRDILAKIGRLKEYSSEALKLLEKPSLKPWEGGKEDPAHPAIHPTGETPPRELEPRERKLFDLVVRRFLATFSDPAMRRKDTAVMTVGPHSFHSHGFKTINPGWTVPYDPYTRLEETPLPKLAEGQEVLFKKVMVEEKSTQPPPRYTPSGLMRLMERLGIGTKATRTDIVDTLYRRGYIHGRRIAATPLAFDVIDVFREVCPTIIEVEFTRSLEEAMERIERGEEEREGLIRKAIRDLAPVMKELRRRERYIGEKLSATIEKMKKSEVAISASCPECHAPLRLVRSRRTGKRFIGCSGYDRGCRFSLPLPQSGRLFILDEACSSCGFPMIRVTLGRGGKTMVSCPLCYEKEGRNPTSQEGKGI